MEGPGKIKQVSVKTENNPTAACLILSYFTLILEMAFQEYAWSEREAQLFILQYSQEYIGQCSQPQPSIKNLKISRLACLKVLQSTSTILTNEQSILCCERAMPASIKAVS